MFRGLCIFNSTSLAREVDAHVALSLSGGILGYDVLEHERAAERGGEAELNGRKRNVTPDEARMSLLDK